MRTWSFMPHAVLPVFALAAACSSSDSGTNQNGSATQMAIQSGNNQVAAAGSPLAPLQVLVRDAAGTPVANVPVAWAVASGGGSVSAASTLSGIDGIASVTRTLGPNAGTQTTTATRAGLTGSPLTFTATATVQGATQMALSTGNGQTDTVLTTLATPYAVIVRDHTNSPVAGVMVSWTAGGGGSMTPTTSMTDASGIATATHTLGGVAGTQTAQATVAGLSGSPVGFSATATAGAPTMLSKTAGDGGASGINTMVVYTVTVRDSHNNPRSSVAVDWEVLSGGGTISPTSTTTDATGQASATRTLSGTAGAHEAYAIAATEPTPDTVIFATNATSAPATAAVSVGNNFFNPSSVTIAVGGTVTWTWSAGAVTHNVTFQTAGAPSNVSNTSSGSFPRTFNSAGTYQYVCTIHGASMSGSVTVQ